MWSMNERLPIAARVDHTLLPIFWKDSPKDWFVHAESVFYDRQIKKDIIKANHVLSALDEDGVSVIRDLIGSYVIYYDDIKQRLINTYTVDDNLKLVNDNNRLMAIKKTISNLTTRVTNLLTVHIPQYLCSNNPQQQIDLCYYHNRYGDDASICQPPCNYQSKALAEVVETDLLMVDKQKDINFLDKTDGTVITLQPSGSKVKKNSILSKKRVRFNVKPEINVIDDMPNTIISRNLNTPIKIRSSLKDQQIFSKLQSKECCKIQ